MTGLRRMLGLQRRGRHAAGRAAQAGGPVPQPAVRPAPRGSSRFAAEPPAVGPGSAELGTEDLLIDLVLAADQPLDWPARGERAPAEPAQAPRPGGRQARA